MNILPWRRTAASYNTDLMRLRNEMDRTFERFFSHPFGINETSNVRFEDWVPPLDITESDDEIELRVEVPGIPANKIEVSVSGQRLVIEGEKEESSSRGNGDYCQSERHFGFFRRVLELPDTADLEEINAEAENGVLRISVAKKPGLKPKRIEIKPTGKRVPMSV